jgi:uncharacterized lipoprotein YajG
MKKYFGILALIVSVLLLTGCEKTTTNITDNNVNRDTTDVNDCKK